MLRPSLPVIVAFSVGVGCATAPAPRVGTAAATAAAEAPLEAPAPVGPPIATDEEYDAVRAEFEALPLGDAVRAQLRARLERWLLVQADRERIARLDDRAADDVRAALTLWDPTELAGHPRDAFLFDVVSRLEPALAHHGAHGAALTMLAAMRTLAPSDASAQSATAHWDALVAWLRAVGDKDHHYMNLLASDLEGVAASWPAPFVVDELAKVYVAGAADHRAPDGLPADLQGLLTDPSGMTMATRLASLYVRVSRPAEALAALRALGPDSTDDTLAGLLEKYVAKTSTADDAIALARRLASPPRPDVAPVVERICVDSVRRFPTDGRLWTCIGDAAYKQGKLVVALRSREKSLAVDPDDWGTWQDLAVLYRQRLVQLANTDDAAGLEGTLKTVEGFYAAAKKKFPDRSLKPTLAGAVFEVGRGDFNAGRLDDAVKRWQQADAMEPGNVEAEEQLAMVALKRADAAGAVAAYRKALETADKIDDGEGPFWRARLERGLGDALDLAGDVAGAKDAWRRALTMWDAFRKGEARSRIGDEGNADVDLERGKLLYLLGRREEAFAAFASAIDALPGRGSTYADVLSFLVPRGEREEALETYHRALGHGEVTEYLKVYCTLWMLDLDRRAGAPPDPMAQAFLVSVDGARWYADLARWATGRASEAEVEARADTPAKRAEWSFYRAEQAWAKGDLATARTLWSATVATHMMAFFEYDMATFYLRHVPAPATATPTTTSTR